MATKPTPAQRQLMERVHRHPTNIIADRGSDLQLARRLEARGWLTLGKYEFSRQAFVCSSLLPAGIAALAPPSSAGDEQ